MKATQKNRDADGARTTSPHGRAVCPYCKGTYALLVDGALRSHRTAGRGSAECPGSNGLPS